MSQRSTRNKIRFQCRSAIDDLEKAQAHMVYMAALAEDRSGYIDDYLPAMITTVNMLLESMNKFSEGL